MPREVNSLEQLLFFLFRLGEEKIHFTLQCSRIDALTVVIPAASRYYEIDFYADGQIECQTFGPAGYVEAVSLEDITSQVIAALNGPQDDQES